MINSSWTTKETLTAKIMNKGEKEQRKVIKQSLSENYLRYKNGILKMIPIKENILDTDIIALSKKATGIKKDTKIPTLCCKVCSKRSGI